MSNEFAAVARQANEDPKKYFVSLIQNRCLLNVRSPVYCTVQHINLQYSK